MTVYFVFTVKVTDDSWLPDYAANVHNIAARHGGKYLSRSANITTIEGEAPDADVMALIEFPSMESAQAWLDDPEYAPYLEARIAGTVSKACIIDDTDATGQIPYLSKA